jgi:cytochrome c nitrite reductase small subunit
VRRLAVSARRVALVVAGLVGIVLGVGAFTFVYARGYSYLGTDPAACANCHVMWEHFDAWAKSSHRQVAACNDCHAPHGLVGKYATKGINGFMHSLAFTTGRFANPIRIRRFNHDITENACRDCHEPIVAAIDPAADPHQAKDDCTRCHKYVGHWVR